MYQYLHYNVYSVINKETYRFDEAVTVCICVLYRAVQLAKAAVMVSPLKGTATLEMPEFSVRWSV